MEQMLAKRQWQAEAEATLEDGSLRACSMEALSSVVAPRPPTRKKAKTERQEEIGSTTSSASAKRPTLTTKPTRSLGELVQQMKHGSKAPRRASVKTVASGSGNSSQQVGKSVSQHFAKGNMPAEEGCASSRDAEPDAAELNAEPEPDAEPDAEGVPASQSESSKIDQNNVGTEDGDRATLSSMESETSRKDLFADKPLAEEIRVAAHEKALAAQVQILQTSSFPLDRIVIASRPSWMLPTRCLWK